jgi:hypothetical protein
MFTQEGGIIKVMQTNILVRVQNVTFAQEGGILKVTPKKKEVLQQFTSTKLR